MCRRGRDARGRARRASRSSSPGVDAVERDDVAPRRRGCPSGATISRMRSIATPSRSVADGDRLARVHASRRARACRAAAGTLAVVVEASSASASATASSAAGLAGARARARRNAARPRGAAQQLDGLHRHEAPARSGGRARSRARRRTTVSTGRPRRARRAARRAARRRVSSATTSWPRAGEVQRDAPGARADVEDRPAGRGRELAPQRQVLVVAAALEVVPDDVERSLTRKYRRGHAAAREQLAQLEHRRVGRQRVRAGRRRRRAPRRARARARGSTSSRSGVDARVLQPHGQLRGARAART